MADKNLEKFIERILEIQNSQLHKRLGDKDLKIIAHDVGLSENEWQMIQKMFNDYLTRAKGFIDYKNYEDAIKELEQAITLNPSHAEALYLKALAHKKRWNQTHNSNDKQLAIKHADDCIQIEPANKKAIELISTLKKSQPVYIPQKSQKESGVIIVIVIVIIIVFVLFVAGFIFFFMTSAPLEVKPLEQIEAVTIESSSETNVDYMPEIPVVFAENVKSAGIIFDIESSEFKSYENSYSYNLKGYLIANQIELSKLKVKIELKDANGKVIISDNKTVLNYHGGSARSGDAIPFNYLKYVKNATLPVFSEVVVTVTYVDKQNAAASYEISKQKDFTWASERPQNYDIEIRQRISNVSTGFNDGVYNKLDLEVENIGNVAIHTLKLELQWFNTAGEMVSSKDCFITSSSNPKIKRGQTRVISATWEIKNTTKEGLDGYKIIVVSIE